MTEESAGEQGGITGWSPDTKFSGISVKALQALATLREPKHFQVFGHAMADQAYNAHGCGGTIMTDLYWDEVDGHLHLGVSMWYECESYLEVLGDVVIQ